MGVEPTRRRRAASSDGRGEIRLVEPPSGVRTTLHAPHGTLENPGQYLTERVRATRWRVEAATEPEARNGHHGDAAPVPVPEELVLGALLEDLRRGG